MESEYHFWSLLPPLVAIFLAIATRRVVLSLFIGILVGCMTLAADQFKTFWQTADGELPGIGEIVFYLPTSIHEYGNFFGKTLSLLFESVLWPSFIDGAHMRVMAFTMLMGAMVGIVYRSGGMIGIANALSPFARTRVGGQITTWLLGMIVFFDDYANTLLLGNTMRPVADRLKISREKLAYIVDSTAAPVAGLAIVSTWVATLIGYVDDGIKSVQNAGHEFAVDPSGFWTVIESIPYRFYVIYALLFIPMLALLKRDFGPMRRAEERALADEATGGNDGNDEHAFGSLAENPKWHQAVIPIVAMVATIVVLLAVTGFNASESKMKSLDIFEVVGNADAYIALLYGSLTGLIVAAFMAKSSRILNSDQIKAAAGVGAKTVLPAIAILWMAWSLSSVTEFLGTGEFVAALLTMSSQPDWMSESVYSIYQQMVSLEMMPTSIFIIACFVAFSTGTSWGTMGIMTPTVVVVIFEMMVRQDLPLEMSHPIMLASVGGVLAGSIFGDHCSPISDTTVLSSQASGCNHIAHVRTQLPYALFVGFVSIACGTIPVGYGVPWYVLLPIGIILLFGFVAIFGRRSAAAAQ